MHWALLGVLVGASGASASAASATGAGDCLPVLRRVCFFLGKMACVLCIEVGEGHWVPAGKPEKHLDRILLIWWYILLAFLGESLALFQNICFCAWSHLLLAFCFFFCSIWIHFYLNSLLCSIGSVNASKDFVRSSWVFCSVGKSLWVEALECTFVMGRTVRCCGMWAELCLSSLRQNDSEGITREIFFSIGSWCLWNVTKVSYCICFRKRTCMWPLTVTAGLRKE